MKHVRSDDWTTTTYYRVHHTYCIPSCSWRRAKKLAKKLGLYQKGSHKKAHPKWTNYTDSTTYNRRRRVLWLLRRDIGPNRNSGD